MTPSPPPLPSPAPQPPTHIYELTRRDLFWAYFTTSLQNRLILGIIGLGVVGSAIFAFMSNDPPLSLPVRVLTSLIQAALWLLIFAALYFIIGIITVLTRSYQGVLGKHKLILTDDGLAEATDSNYTVHYWKGFHRIRETPDYIYLYATRVLYHTVPKASFASVREMENFLAEIRKRWSDAQK